MVFQSALAGARRGLSQQGLELGERLLDGVQVRRVGRQGEEAGTDSPDRLAHAGRLVGCQVVQDHDIAGREGGGENLPDVGLERLARHGPVEHHGRHQAGAAQARHEGRGAPVPVRGDIDQALAPGVPAVVTHHLGAYSGLVDEHEGRRVHERLPAAPQPAVLRDVGPVLLGSPQRLFLCDRPRRRSVAQIVVSEPASIPRSPSLRCNSTSVRDCQEFRVWADRLSLIRPSPG